ncbi:cytochrome P450, partial [Mycobacterium sp.]|uniref:cytochrome P450 n=1 Tax=Mycobacterium sp. TaxID=1785 RepID=UPI002BACA666
MAFKQRLHWLALHGFVRGGASIGARRGDLQARLIADPTVKADPVPFYEEVRARGPLARSRIGYITADHAVGHELLRSDDFRVLSIGSNLPAPLRWLEGRTRDELLHPLRPPSLLAVEPPDHTRYRKTVSSVFTTRAVAALRDGVEQTAETLLDQLSREPGVVDIVDRYCAQLPVAIISDILGVPDADRQRVLEFGELAAPSLDFGLTWPQYRRVQRGIAGFNFWLVEHLQQLRRNPGDDLMSQLIQKAESGSEETYLDESELHAVAGLVLAAGFETTVNLLGNGIRMLLDTPEHLHTLSQRPDLWPNAVEEILRLESPVQLTARLAVNDTEIAGTAIKQGELVIVYVAAANRDPAVFADPDRFDIERDNAGKHLSFSGGRHFCLGAALARAEGEVGLRTFF